MNAAEQALGLEATTKIAAVVNLFKAQFPDVKADLKPWVNDPDIQDLVDPDSIDIGFHLPGWSRLCQSRSILVQIRFYTDPVTDLRRAIGVEAAGFTHLGEQWRLSTIESWQFVGNTQPVDEVKEKLKLVCRQIVELFNSAASQ
ncbi:hypothetical protein H6G89_17110 [Oscillatoria sp. FACHB-1407]|uniref:hypothetical protein n=1 Tax=Oscillatoria sp. FACHB-1407 TaxID=2692847 RepID=UPI001683DEB6|nr:hypothetical protein [Oscillatoria sp. FACHB-1407]MBD2462762.1 hypothetical protein [Oscillatoria sp. FACHB-1407]